MYPKSLPFRHKTVKWLTVVFVCLTLIGLAVTVYLHWFSPLDRDWVVKTLGKRYESYVELKSFHASLFPSVSIEGKGLILRRKDSPDLPPMTSVDRFSVGASWFGLLLHPRRVTLVRLEGLVINVPPRNTQPHSNKKQQVSPFLLDYIFADGTVLNILSADPKKPPHVFNIQRLRLQSAGVGQPMSFQAILTNPKPVGQIQSTGRFGPWNTDDPSQTSVLGSYTFRDVDLSTIHGLAGILSAQGGYEGVLSRIKVQGETFTPKFALGISGHPVNLETQFTAVVDGTNGDTFLRPVSAQLLGSTIMARGGVAKTTGEQGRIILLQLNVAPARLEDLLRLAVKSAPPPMVGEVKVETTFDLHPGNEDVVKRIEAQRQLQY